MTKKIEDYIKKLEARKSLTEKVMLKCENHLRYLELKAHCETIQIVIRELEELQATSN